VSEQQPTTEAATGDPVVEPGPSPTADAPAQEVTPAPDPVSPAVGPKIIGVAPEQRPVPVVKKKLREKPPPPKRDPLPFPELRAVVALVKADEALDVPAIKELFRLLPPKVRDEVVEGVREFRKGARRPLSQHAAKSLARAVHTARRQKRAAAPGTEVGEAIAQAIIGELVASLEVERAAEVILPKRDLLDREARQAYRKRRDEEEKRRDEERKRRREDAKGFRGQNSFGEFKGTKIKGLDEIAAALGMVEEQVAEAVEEAPAPEAAAKAPAGTPVAAVEVELVPEDEGTEVPAAEALEPPADEPAPDA
jgi:hypothetical protein